MSDAGQDEPGIYARRYRFQLAARGGMLLVGLGGMGLAYLVLGSLDDGTLAMAGSDLQTVLKTLAGLVLVWLVVAGTAAFLTAWVMGPKGKWYGLAMGLVGASVQRLILGSSGGEDWLSQRLATLLGSAAPEWVVTVAVAAPLVLTVVAGFLFGLLGERFSPFGPGRQFPDWPGVPALRLRRRSGGKPSQERPDES